MLDNDKNNNGNALFLILIAVCLFAALTYAVTQSNRGDGVSMSREIADNRAAELVNYGNAIKDAVNKLILRGCDENQINFTNIYFPVSNGSSPADGRCNVFDVNGGGVAARLFGSEYLDATQSDPAWIGYKGQIAINGCNRIQYVGTDTAGLAAVDVLGIFTGVNSQICKAINKRYNINPPNFTPITTGLYGCWTSNSISVDGSFITAMNELRKGGGCYYVPQYGGYTSYFIPLMER